MKANRNFFAFSLIAALGLCISACDDDDDDNAADSGAAGESGSGGSAGAGAAGEEVSAPANDLCENAIELALGETLSGTSRGAHSEGELQEPDVYYKIHVDSDGWYEFAMTHAEKAACSWMEIWKSCAPAQEYVEDDPNVIQNFMIHKDDNSSLLSIDLTAGDYNLVVKPAGCTPDVTMSEGADFTVSYLLPKKPEITSVQASLKLADDDSQNVIAFRFNGKDPGLDVKWVYYKLFNAQNEQVSAGGDPNSIRIYPNFDLTGQFVDAFAAERLSYDLTSVVKAEVWLQDDEHYNSAVETVEISNSFEVVQRNAHESCDLFNLATTCAGDSFCSLTQDEAAICRTGSFSSAK